MKVSLSGNALFLNLNGQDVYERILAPANQRTFGLFHYADQTESRIRNVIWRGNWPRTLPPVSEQELAGDFTDFLDDDLVNLTAVRTHDFSLDGLPSQAFTVFHDREPFVMVEEADGLRMDREGVDASYRRLALAPRCIVRGDFDVTASFVKFNAAPARELKDTMCSVLLSASLSDREQTGGFVVLRFLRRPGKTDKHVLRATVARRESNELRTSGFGEIPYDGEGGTLRLARRGKQMYYLIAEEGSSWFRLIGEETWSDADVTTEGIRIQTQIAGLTEAEVVQAMGISRATASRWRWPGCSHGFRKAEQIASQSVAIPERKPSLQDWEEFGDCGKVSDCVKADGKPDNGPCTKFACAGNTCRKLRK
jgi:hypothetical protein